MIYSDFQGSVYSWLLKCFGKDIVKNPQERNKRFMEEAIELVQSTGMNKDDILSLVDHVYAKEKGDPTQEVGGVLVCLAALCTVNGIGMVYSGNKELNRIVAPEIISKIRRKHAAKPAHIKGDYGAVQS